MGVKESGTSLFYKYLLDNNYLKESKILKEISEIVEKIKVITLNINDFDYRIGYVKTPYKYRNDINEFIIKEGNKQNIDIIGMIMTDIDTVSYRQVKNYDVSIIAKHFGGKGHVGASSNSQDNKLFKKMIEENKIEFI